MATLLDNNTRNKIVNMVWNNNTTGNIFRDENGTYYGRLAKMETNSFHIKKVEATGKTKAECRENLCIAMIACSVNLVKIKSETSCTHNVKDVKNEQKSSVENGHESDCEIDYNDGQESDETDCETQR